MSQEAKFGGKDIDLERVKAVIEEFKIYLKRKNLWMGSSQGTCSRCSACTGAYQIQTGVVGNDPKEEWMHPIHFMPFNGNVYRLVEMNLRHHAFLCFFLDDSDGWDLMTTVLIDFLEGRRVKRLKEADNAKAKENEGEKG